MIVRSKDIDPPRQIVNVEEYDFFRKINKGKDRLPKLLLLLLIPGVIMGYTLSVYNSMYKGYEGDTGTMFIIAGIALSVFFFVFGALLMIGHTKRLDSSAHLFFFKEEKRQFKIVDNFSNSSVSVNVGNANTEELDENGRPVYYAEEIYEDDEEDIFVTEAQSTALKKEKELTYAELIESLNESLESYGITGDLAKSLFSSMAFSKLIDVTEIHSIIPTLFRVLDNPNYIIHYSAEESITSQRVLLNTFEYGKTHPNIPVFILFDEIPSKEFLNYLRPLYRYIDDINGDYYISANGVAVHIPHNVYFLVSLRENDIVFDISRRYLRYISILHSEFHVGEEPEGEKKKFNLTLEQLNNARRNSMDNFAVEESTYKKLDLLFNTANEANGYVLQNKIQRKIEEYSALLLSLGIAEDEVIDLCLANNIIAAVVISSNVTKLMNEFNLSTILENEFGQDKMKLTKAMIKDYLSLFNSKGERTNE